MIWLLSSCLFWKELGMYVYAIVALKQQNCAESLCKLASLDFTAGIAFVSRDEHVKCSSEYFLKCFKVPFLLKFMLTERKQKKEYFCTLKIKKNSLFLGYPSCYHFQVLQARAGKWLERHFLLLKMWNLPSFLWKYLLKGRNWSLMVNSLSQTISAHPSRTVFIYPYYYLERIILWVPFPQGSPASV